MKTSKIYLASIFCLLGLIACDNDNNKLVLTHVETSILDNIPAQSYILTEPEDDDANPLLFTATWTETLFYLDDESRPTPAADITYVLEVDRKGNNFANAEVIAGTNGLSSDIYLRDFNLKLVSDLKAKPEEAIDVEIRVVAQYGKNLAGIGASGNTLPLKVTPYKARKLQPIYIIGDMNNWNNEDTNFITYRSSNDRKDETYTYTGYFNTNTKFKFILEEDLGTNLMFCRNDAATMAQEIKEDGAFLIETAGYKTINVDLATMKYTIVDYAAGATAKTYTTLGPIGGFCGWDNEPPMTKSAYDPHKWFIEYEFNVGTACKFRGDKDWSNNWGADASDIPFGKAIFDGSGADLKVGKYKIYFNDLTGHTVILLQ